MLDLLMQSVAIVGLENCIEQLVATRELRFSDDVHIAATSIVGEVTLDGSTGSKVTPLGVCFTFPGPKPAVKLL